MDCILSYKGKDYTEKEFKKEYFGRIHTELFKEGEIKEDFVFDGDIVKVIARNKDGAIKYDRLTTSTMFEELKKILPNPQIASKIYTALKFMESSHAREYVDRKIKELKERNELEIDCTGKAKAGVVSSTGQAKIVHPGPSNEARKAFSIKKP